MIYVASSWRNPYQQDVVATLRENGHEVYDFRNPKDGDKGFHWSEIDKAWKLWHPKDFIESLSHPLAEAGFQSDFLAMKDSDTCILVLPCGSSAHLEAGWFTGNGKRLFILMYEEGHSYSNRACPACGDTDGCHGGVDPELMYKMADGVFWSFSRLMEEL